jgi:predicted transcriptional regulator
MRKIILIILVVFVSCTNLYALDLKVGEKATFWKFMDSENKIFTMQKWAGKVLFINYVDPDEKEVNEHVNDAMKKASNNDLLKLDLYKGIGIVDCDATWIPDSLIKSMAGKKAKKFKTIILFDYDATLRKKWNLKEDASNIILLDKNRVCRAIYKDKVSAEDTKKLVELAIKLQNQ